MQEEGPGRHLFWLPAAEQVAKHSALVPEHPKARVVDPVMGDGGKMYPTYTQRAL